MRDRGVCFFVGVPDSLLSGFSSELEKQLPNLSHRIVANEGVAISAAVGHFLISGKPALVYLQNSGLPNAANPLLSLASKSVYSIPMILMIGWRGEVRPGGGQVDDEPQHLLMGSATCDLLDLLRVPFQILDEDRFTENVDWAVNQSIENSSPVALLVRRGSLASTSVRESTDRSVNGMLREESIRVIIDSCSPQSRFVVSTGMASREFYEQARKSTHKFFLNVGAMGHAAGIAVGVAMANPRERIICVDGDGSFLMHLGVGATSSSLQNLTHIVLNNRCHDSVGGQPTPTERLDVCEIARALGYSQVLKVSSRKELQSAIRETGHCSESVFIEVVIVAGFRGNLGRPKESPLQLRTEYFPGSQSRNDDA